MAYEKIATVKVAREGTLTVRVTSPKFPQLVVGKIWRYDHREIEDGEAGVFYPNHTDVDLGSAENANRDFFLVEGAVLHMNEAHETPYQVELSIRQNNKVIYSDIPEYGGKGRIGKEDIPFNHRFIVEVA